jgi:hypothetical protein
MEPRMVSEYSVFMPRCTLYAHVIRCACDLLYGITPCAIHGKAAEAMHLLERMS